MTPTAAAVQHAWAGNFFRSVVSTRDRKKASGLIRFAAGDPEAEME
jgi:hypothetical protein